MKQADLGLDLGAKRTRKRQFLDEMERVVPWARLLGLIEPHYPKGRTGRPPFPVATMLRIHFLQQWFGLSDPAMEEALFDVPMYREFAQLPGGISRLPDESTILRFRHLLETHGLAGDSALTPSMSKPSAGKGPWADPRSRSSLARSTGSAHGRACS
jgi:IS5 family transposase